MQMIKLSVPLQRQILNFTDKLKYYELTKAPKSYTSTI